MSRKLGSEFLLTSENMTKTCVIPDFITEDLSFYRSQLMKVMQNVCDKDKHATFRVWIGAEESKAYHQKVVETPPLGGEDITQWSERVYGDKKFGMIINNIESFAPALNRKILEVLGPVISQTQVPAGGFDMALFVGNYGWTPIGIHKDLNGGRVLHFHFGPGPKVIYQWEDAAHDELHVNDPKREHVENWIPKAKAYHFKAGDLYFMNEEMWHIGYSEELSVGLTFWFNNYDRKELFKRLNVYLRDKLLENNQVRLPAFSTASHDMSRIDFPINSSNPYKGEMEKFFQYLYEDYKLEMLSNGGFYTPPTKQNTKELTLDTRVQCALPYQVCYKQQSDELIDLFIRGYKLSVFSDPALPSVLDEINNGKSAMIGEIAAPLLEGWDESVVIYIFSLLYVHGGIELVNENQDVNEVVENKQLATTVH